MKSSARLLSWPNTEVEALGTFESFLAISERSAAPAPVTNLLGVRLDSFGEAFPESRRSTLLSVSARQGGDVRQTIHETEERLAGYRSEPWNKKIRQLSLTKFISS